MPSTYQRSRGAAAAANLVREDAAAALGAAFIARRAGFARCGDSRTWTPGGCARTRIARHDSNVSPGCAGGPRWRQPRPGASLGVEVWIEHPYLGDTCHRQPAAARSPTNRFGRGSIVYAKGPGPI